MDMRKPASIKKKLLLISILTTGAAMLLANIIFVGNEITQLKRTMADNLTVQAQIVGNNSTVALAFNNKKDAAMVLGALNFAPNIVRAGVFTREGTLFAAYQRPGAAGLPEYPVWATDGHRFELNRLTIVKPIVLDGEAIGSISIESDLRDFYLDIAQYVGVALLVFAGAIIFIFTLLSKLQKTISDPILKLAELTRSVSQDRDYSVRSAVQSGDEIGVLSEGLNEMLSQIQKRDQELEQHRKHLEELVSLRTAELTQVNQLLQKKLVEQKKAEESLQKSEKRYRMLFESAGDAIFLLEAEGADAGKIVEVNKTAAEMHGYTVDELLQKNIQELDTPEAARNAPQLIRRILGGEWIKSYEVTHRRKNGTVFFAEISAGLLELGNHKYILAFDRNIMERKEAEEQIVHTQQTLQTIMNSLPYGVVVIGMDKRIRSINKAALELIGYDREEHLVGMTCHQSFCPADKDNCPIVDLHNKVDHAEKILITKDNKRIPILKTVVPIEIEGEKALLEAFIDITSQKTAEQKLQQYAADLKQSNEDVLSFAYIVSHDLRAPLVSIKGFTGELQLALKKMETVIETSLSHLGDQERSRIAMVIRADVPEAMKFIGSSVDRMDGLINNILKLSRAGHRELKPELIDMKILTNSILSSLAHQIERSRTSVIVEELPVITADRIAMEQIMGNLLDNALKYLEQGREGKIIITAEQGAHDTTFHVRDNGRGVAGDDLTKIFEIFRRAGKQDVAGEGMGLAYVKALVKRHDGRIWCESELGAGTTFSFTVPHAREPMG